MSSPERICVDVEIRLWFDAPSFDIAKRRFVTTARICSDTDIDDVASQIARELGEEWARKTRVRDPNLVREYMESIQDYISHYLHTALQEFLENLERSRPYCMRYPQYVVFENGADGYYVEREQRGMYIEVSANVPCREISSWIEAIYSSLGTPVRRVELIRELIEKLSDCEKHVIAPIINSSAPHEIILNWLEVTCFRDGSACRWWYTIYYTRNR